MRQSILTKAFTLLCFASLIIIFLLYRVGKFDNVLANEAPAMLTSANGGGIAANSLDTSITINDSLQRLMLSSSKSIVLIDKTRKPIDSAKKKVHLDTLRKRQIELMSSSKSTILFKSSSPQIPLKLNVDSVMEEFKKRKKQ